MYFLKMNKIEECCCVCLNKFLDFNYVSKRDENSVTFLTKLETSIPQIEWRNTYLICEPCTNLLNIVYKFRETCIKSDSIRKLQLQKLDKDDSKDARSLKTEAQTSRKYDLLNNIEIDDNCSVGANWSIKNENGVKDEDEDNDDEDDNDDDTNDEDSNDVDNEEEEKTDASVPKRRRVNVSFQCEQCSNKYISSTLLVRHCVDEHDMDIKQVRPFACNRCKSRFVNSSNLLQHIKYHEAVRSNMCTYCGKGFITKTDLKVHEKQHINMREYKCEDCFKCFNTHKDLRSHKLVVHTDPHQWKHFCSICNKYFPIKSNYDSHMRRHTGDKRFECHLCKRKFTDKCVMQRHMKTHSNIRDFKCAHCTKEYKDRRVLQIHMAKVHGIGVGDIKLPTKERRYICHICPKAYYAKNKLTRHLYTHSGEKPFFCEICNKKFNDKSYVKQHMKRTHNIEVKMEEF